MIQESDVIKVLEQVLERELPDVDGGTRLLEELSLDSTAVLEVLMAIEESLGVSFDPEDLEPQHLNSVSALTEFVRNQN
ncbi:acyl carrier protein [Actinoplanes sp. TBRC 11911]|uniref:acyl carrier protein n=1 Tax=Actinoplanes sp. TBRC 11911 TaxID=2729386 RepID=UPI00145D9301|nr:acyl carrier protein [Actinoplanes sp. TBRC 11911]NMO53360.1 acyl carrier protein [Actinoplanes sp. TBRC 11911]